MSDADPREQLNELLNLLIPLAKQHLSNYGEFYPFGASLTVDGETKFDAAYTGEEQPASQDLLALLRDAGRHEAGTRMATGICYDVKIHGADGSGTSDAIAVDLEHREGDSMSVFLPYRITESGPVYDDASLFVEARARTFWIDPTGRDP